MDLNIHDERSLNVIINNLRSALEYYKNGDGKSYHDAEEEIKDVVKELAEAEKSLEEIGCVFSG